MFIDFLFPIRCVGCLRAGSYLCSLCSKRLIKAIQVCPNCTKPSINGMTHDVCFTKLSLNGSFCVWKYQGPIRKAVLTMKYRYVYDIGDLVAGLLATNLKQKKLFRGSLNVVLIPVPAHKKRRNIRGFNQAEVIGELLAGKMGWRYRNDILIKSKYTSPQTGLARKKRLANQRDSFKVVSTNGLKNTQKVFLFDDIWTTGATIKEAAKPLKRCGIEDVWGLTVAKT